MSEGNNGEKRSDRSGTSVSPAPTFSGNTAAEDACT
jgi:hypothetical protein